jgi:uncharacterized coiled-coil protein SlyX
MKNVKVSIQSRAKIASIKKKAKVSKVISACDRRVQSLENKVKQLEKELMVCQAANEVLLMEKNQECETIKMEFEEREAEWESSASILNNIIIQMEESMVEQRRSMAESRNQVDALTSIIATMKAHMEIQSYVDIEKYYQDKIEEVRHSNSIDQAKAHQAYEESKVKAERDHDEEVKAVKTLLNDIIQTQEGHIARLTEMVQDSESRASSASPMPTTVDIDSLKAEIAKASIHMQFLEQNGLEDNFIVQLKGIFFYIQVLIEDLENSIQQVPTPVSLSPYSGRSPQPTIITEYQCIYCDRTFAREGAYHNHLKVRHFNH